MKISKRKKKTFIVIAVITTIILVAIRIIFLIQSAAFEKRILEIERKSYSSYIAERKKIIDSIDEDTAVYNLFMNYIDTSKYIISTDTSYTFLYLSKDYEFKKYLSDYYICLKDKCILEIKNKEVLDTIASREERLKIKYLDVFDLAYPLIKDNKLIISEFAFSNCDCFFDSQTKLELCEECWTEFEDLLEFYSIKKKQLDNENNLKISQVENNVISFRRKLDSRIYESYDDLIDINLKSINSVLNVKKMREIF